MPGNPLGVTDHGEKVSGRECLLAVVSYANFLG